MLTITNRATWLQHVSLAPRSSSRRPTRAMRAHTHFPYIHNGGLLRLASTQYGYFNPLLTSRTFVGHFLLWMWWVGLNGSVYNTSIDCYEWHNKSSLPRWSMERSIFPFASPRRRSSKPGTLQGSPRETSFTVPRVNTVNICFITPHP